jgi:hypothetical protein
VAGHEHRQLVAASLAIVSIVDEAGPAASQHAETSSATASSKRCRSEALRPPVRPHDQALAKPVGGPSMQVTTATGSPLGWSRDGLQLGKGSWSTFSTQRSMMPPQVRPDLERVVVADAVPLQLRIPVAIACWQSSYTAPSTHPPETLPTAVPSVADEHDRAAPDEGRCARCRPQWPCRPGGRRATNR